MTEPSEAQVKYLEAFIICKMLQWHGGFEFRFLQRLSAPHLKRHQRWEALNLAVARASCPQDFVTKEFELAAVLLSAAVVLSSVWGVFFAVAQYALGDLSLS